MQQYSAKELEAWRSSTWSEWTCTNCQTVAWSGQKKCRHCGVKESYAAALWSGWAQPKPNSSSQVSQQLQQVAAQLQSACGNDPAHPSQSLDVSIVESSGSWEDKRQIKQVEKALNSLDVDTPALECARKMLEQQTHRVEDTAESSTTVEQKIGKRERCSAESSKESGRSEGCVHSGPDCQRIGGPRSSENSSRTLHARRSSSQSSYRSRRRTPTRCSDIIDNTISALHKAGAPTEHLEQARQAAYTLISGLQGLCAAAGAVTVADEPEDPMMDFDGSDEEFRQDEEIARSVRRRLTYKRSQTGKEIITVTSPADLLLAPHTTPCE